MRVKLITRLYLGSSINLGLPRILALTEYSRGEELVSVLAAHEIGRLEEDRCTIVPGHILPVCFRSKSTIDSGLDCGFIRFMIDSKVFRMI
jgi:hypothetical protein